MNKSKNYYENIDIENERLLKYISTSEKKINDLSSFLNDIYSNCLNLYKSTIKKLSSFFDISKVSDVTTKTDQNLTFFYQTSLIFLNNLSDIIEKFNLIIITPLNEFKINYTKENNLIKKDFLLLLKDYKNEKKKLISFQKQYYNGIINYINIKNNYHNLSKNKNKEDKNEKYLNEMREKRFTMKNKKQLYKYQVGTVNILYKNYDLRYKQYYKSFEKNERNKLIFLYNTFHTFSLKVKELTNSLNELSLQINTKFNGWKIEEDNNIIKDEFNYIGRYINSENIYNDSNTIQRFNKEIYMPYNMANMNYINNFYNNNDRKSHSDLNNDKILEQNNNSVEEDGEKNIIITNDKKEKEMQNNIIVKFYEYFYSNDDIPYDLISNIIETAINNNEFCYKFIENYYSEQKNKYFQINKEKNIKHFFNILLNILISIKEKNDSENENNKKIIIKILRIGQLMYYIVNNKNKKQNIFLCVLLNKYIEFKNNNFWVNLLLFKIKNKLQKIYSKIKEPNNKDDKKTINKEYKIKKLLNNPDIFISLLNKNNIDDKINNKSDENEKNSEKKIMSNDIKSTNETNDEEVSLDEKKINNNAIKENNDEKESTNNISNNENDKQVLSDEIKNKYLQIAFHKFHKIILEFIPFLVNYKFGFNNSKSLINQICIKLNLKQDLIDFYLSYLKSYSYSIKQYFLNLYHKLNKKIEEFYLNKNKLENKTDNKSKKLLLNEKDKLIIILNISKYLDNIQKIRLIRLNKFIHDKIYKKIYKEILYYSDKEKRENRNYKIHINIWKNFLDYKDIKKKYPYEINKKKTFSKKHQNYEKSDFFIIDLDCQRTLFENISNINANINFNSYSNNDKNDNRMINNINNYRQKSIEMKRMSLNNILKTLITLNPEPTYCQGMNFIVVFLLKLLNEREDDAFYLMLGLFKCTTYPQIFHDNLLQLTMYFKIFDRLLFIFIPTLYNYFKSNNVIPNYYLSSCFITLFTNYANKEKKINLFIKIFDLFIIDGWKSIFNIIMEIMWRNEEKLLSLKNENLLHFLNGNLVNDFLVNYKTYNCLELHQRQKISNNLIKNLEYQLINSSKLGISFE